LSTASGPARSWRELFRCHPEAGSGELTGAAGKPVQFQERRDNAGGVIAGQGAGCFACSSRSRAVSGRGGSGGASQTPNVAIRPRRVLVIARYARASALFVLSFAPIACWFRPNARVGAHQHQLCCRFAPAERIPAGALGAAVVGNPPRWPLSRLLVAAPRYSSSGHGWPSQAFWSIVWNAMAPGPHAMRASLGRASRRSRLRDHRPRMSP
jgi:hypothetical protein